MNITDAPQAVITKVTSRGQTAAYWQVASQKFTQTVMRQGQLLVHFVPLVKHQ